MELNKNEISVHSACDVDSTLLIDYFKKAFPQRANFLESNWKWLNRSNFYDNKIPLVLIYKNQVIGYAGMISFNLSIGGNVQKASWFIDFKLLPEFQRKGLGGILTKEWMSFSDCFVGSSANEKSVGILTKNRWIESHNTFMHLNFIRPFNYPKFIGMLPSFLRSILNLIMYPFFFLFYSRNSYPDGSYQLVKFNEKSFYDFFSLYDNSKRTIRNTVSPIRDINYFKWRLSDSPNKDKYFIYKTDKFSAVVSLQNNYQKYIDILLVSDLNNKVEINKMISTLGMYGIKNGFSYMRFYTSKKELSAQIKSKTKSIVRHPRFVFFSQDKGLLEELKNNDWEFELIDSDFEHFS